MKQGIVLALSCALLSAPALAQDRTLQLDINNLAFQANNALGAPAAFGGTSHTGSLHMTHQAQMTELVGVLMKTGTGPFILQSQFTGSLTAATVEFNLNNGAVVGGMMSFDVNGGPGSGGNRYSATITPGAIVETYVGGGFQINGLTTSGMFSGPDWGGVGIADFFAAQGGASLPGSYLAFRIQPDSQGAGSADIDVFVIPSPGSLACLAVGGLLAMRRRR
jgi:hypothetical protein